MKCISLHSPSLLNFSSSKFTWRHHKSKPNCFLEQHSTGVLKGQRTLLVAPLKADAVNSSAAAAAGDLSVLLQTGAVMFFIYWIVNFVVPQFILKDLQDDSTTNNNKADEKDPL